MGSLVYLLLWGLLAQEAAFETPEYDLQDVSTHRGLPSSLILHGTLRIGQLGRTFQSRFSIYEQVSLVGSRIT